MTFHPDHWTRFSSATPLGRLICEVMRRSGVVGIFSNDAPIIRLTGALILEQNNDWAASRR
jgi:putative transposase